jgi:hypothetical protein
MENAMKRLSYKLLALSLALCMPASMLAAETPAAMLYSTGNFALNGAVGPRSSAVMPGDQIQTRNSSVSITSTGNNVLIGPNSSITYEKSAIQFAGGTAVVSTSTSMAAQVQDATIAPTQPKATYRITRTGNQVLIAAVKGNLLLRQGSETRTIAEGRSAYMPDPVPQAVPGAQQPAGSRPNAKIGIIIGAAALGATTAIILTQIGGESQPVSPSLP